MSAQHAHTVRWRVRARHRDAGLFDLRLAAAALTLLGLGLVMVASSSMGLADRELGDPFYYVQRQGAYAVLALACAAVVIRVPLAWWARIDRLLLVAAIVSLVAVLIPGLGKSVNGSQRWLSFGPLNLQVSEVARLCIIVYLAGFLVRHAERLRYSAAALLQPMAVVGLIGTLLLLEPDFGAAVVLTASAFGMLFLGGVRLLPFLATGAAAGAAALVLALSSHYRVERLTSFLNPWADPYDRGFQLTQSLIAIGRGEWLGVGLGDSVQKLFYLPEPHTDFLFAVLAEELGLLGVAAVIGLYAFVVWRAFAAGVLAAGRGRPFGAYLAYGVAIWVGLQAFINVGVNMGVLPTKGLTLPLMSYGGSSVVVTSAALALVLRVGYEARQAEASAPQRRGRS